MKRAPAPQFAIRQNDAGADNPRADRNGVGAVHVYNAGRGGILEVSRGVDGVVPQLPIQIITPAQKLVVGT